MTFTAFTGCAGCGKTYQLMARLQARLMMQPMQTGQKVLALTFMHGSRKRLEARLNCLDLSGAKFEATVIDRFAARLLHRWRALAAQLNLGPFEDEDYDGRCAAAGTLLGQPQVRNWVVATYPIILLDEAQDLKPERLALFQALEDHADLYVAADGFQCLDPNLRNSAVMDWTQQDNRHTELTQIHRTDQAGLLAAARALREGEACPMQGPGFKIYASDRGPNFANFNAAMALGINAWDTAAIISPTMRSQQVTNMLVRLQDRPMGARDQFGPYTIAIETGPEKQVQDILDVLELPDSMTMDQAMDALAPQEERLPVKRTQQWLKRQMRVAGRLNIEKAEIEQVLHHQAQEHTRYAPAKERGLQAMTVHGAKNREFDGVVVVWPYQVSGDDEQKRRLLYNAVTRAKRWCAVVCMRDTQLGAAPFV